MNNEELFKGLREIVHTMFKKTGVSFTAYPCHNSYIYSLYQKEMPYLRSNQASGYCARKVLRLCTALLRSSNVEAMTRNIP